MMNIGRKTGFVPFEILLHAESALINCENTEAVLNMWLDNISPSDEYRDEARKVDAVMTLLSHVIHELREAMTCFEQFKAQHLGE